MGTCLWYVHRKWWMGTYVYRENMWTDMEMSHESWVMRQPNQQHLRDCLYFVDRHLRAIHMAPQTALPCHATCHPSFTYPINKSSKTSFNIKIYYTYSIYKDGTIIIFLVQNINKNFSINNINIIRFKTMLIYKNPN